MATLRAEFKVAEEAAGTLESIALEVESDTVYTSVRAPMESERGLGARKRRRDEE